MRRLVLVPVLVRATAVGVRSLYAAGAKGPSSAVASDLPRETGQPRTGLGVAVSTGVKGSGTLGKKYHRRLQASVMTLPGPALWVAQSRPGSPRPGGGNPRPGRCVLCVRRSAS